MSITNDYRYDHKPCPSKTADKLSLPLRCALNGKTVRLVDGKKDLRDFKLGERILAIVFLILFPPLLIISGLALLSKKSCMKAKIPAVLLTKQPETTPLETEENETSANPSIPSLKTSKLIRKDPPVKPPETSQKKTTQTESTAPSTKNSPPVRPTTEKPATTLKENAANVTKVAEAVDAFILGTLQFTQEAAATPSLKQENPTPTPPPVNASLLPPAKPEEITPTKTPNLDPVKPAEIPLVTLGDDLDEGVPTPSLDIIGFIKEAAAALEEKKRTVLELFLQYGRKLQTLSFNSAFSVLSQSLEKTEEILAYIKEFKGGKKTGPADLNPLKMANASFINKLIENLNDSPEIVIAIFKLLHDPKVEQGINDPEKVKQTLLDKINGEIIEKKNFLLFQTLSSVEDENGIIKQAYLKKLLIETLEGMGNLNSDTVDVWCNCDLEIKSYFRALLLFSEIDSLINDADFSLPKVTEELKKAHPLLSQLSPELLDRKKLKATEDFALKLQQKVEAKGGQTLEQTNFRDVFNEIKVKLGWTPDIKIKSNTLLDPISTDYYYFIGEDPQKIEAARVKFMDAADRLGRGEEISDFKAYFESLGGTGAKIDDIVNQAAEKAAKKAAARVEKKTEPEPEAAAPTDQVEADAVETEVDEE